MRLAPLASLALGFTLLGACSDDTPAAPAATTTVGGGTGSGGAGGQPTGPTVQTKDGPVVGTSVGETTAFFGIPFAAPPVEELRFKPPQPVEPWTEPIARTEAAANCPQRDFLTGHPSANTSEDCLTLNVWRPDPVPEAPLPVMVWIHGGGFEIGSGHDGGSYGGEHLVPSGVVLVTINYRLGPFGFLAHPDLTAEDAKSPTSGNYGVQDQQLALAWVRDNIAAFGGDPSSVTLFGESAGGMSVCTHMVVPGSSGLFHRAIVESGPCHGPATDLATAEAQGVKLADAVGCTTDIVSCLRSKKTDDILTALDTVNAFFFGEGARWGPNVDSVVLPDAPGTLLDDGKVENVPTIVGSNKDEGTLFVALAGMMGIDEMQYLQLIDDSAASFGTDAATLEKQYPASAYPSPGRALSAILGEGFFNCPARRMARALDKAGVTTYLYHFIYELEFPGLGDLGAFHSAEIPFVFGNTTWGVVSLDEAEKPLATEMMGYWIRFAEAGDPKGIGTAWPKYTASAEEHIVLDLNAISTGANLLTDACDFWDSLIQK